jgi:predicted phage-related endonuclease
MLSETVITASQEEIQEDTIPSHPALKVNGTALSLTFDFSLYLSSFWTGEAFIPYRSTLLTTLPQYFSPHQRITKLRSQYYSRIIAHNPTPSALRSGIW